METNEYKALQHCLVVENQNYAASFKAHFHLDSIRKLGNFATLSDLLRVMILHQEGGLYMDCDNEFRSQPVKKNNDSERFTFLLRDLSHGKLYSNKKAMGNSVLASHAKNEACVTLLKMMLQEVLKQKKGSMTIRRMKNLQNMVLEKDSYLKNLFNEVTRKNPYMEDFCDGDLIRYGKDPNGYKLDYLKNFGGVRNKEFINDCYPYTKLAMKIGPDALDCFERSKFQFSARFPENWDIEQKIKINSDQAWL